VSNGIDKTGAWDIYVAERAFFTRDRFQRSHTPGLLVSPQPDWRTSDDTLRCTGYGMQDVPNSVH
jgi:hypothetical protein